METPVSKRLRTQTYRPDGETPSVGQQPQELAAALQARENQLEELKQKFADFRQYAKDLSGKSVLVRAKDLSESYLKGKELKEAKETNEVLETKLAELANDNTGLSAALAAKMKELGSVTKAKQVLETELDAVKKEKRTLESTLLRRNQKLASETKALVEAKDQLLTQLEEKVEELEGVTKAKHVLETELAEADALKGRLKKLVNDNTGLSAELAAKMKELGSVTKAKQALRKELDAVKKEKQTLDVTLLRGNQKLASETKALVEAKDQLDKLAKEKTDLESKLKARAAELTAKGKELVSANETHVAKIDRIKAELEEERNTKGKLQCENEKGSTWALFGVVNGLLTECKSEVVKLKKTAELTLEKLGSGGATESRLAHFRNFDAEFSRRSTQKIADAEQLAGQFWKQSGGSLRRGMDGSTAKSWSAKLTTCIEQLDKVKSKCPEASKWFETNCKLVLDDVYLREHCPERLTSSQTE